MSIPKPAELYRPTAGVVALVLSLTVLAAPVAASVYNIHLYTDSTPDYVSREDFVQTATGIWEEPQDQAIALWRWMVRGHRQTHATREDGRALFDPIFFYNSYANTYCGYVAGYFTSFIDEMGPPWAHRYVALSDHTVAECSWDGGADWHMFDTSMVIYAFGPDGTVASCADIQAAGVSPLSLALGETGPVAGHAYLYHAAPECMTNPVNPVFGYDLAYPWGYRRACDKPVDYSRTLRNGADSYRSFTPQTWYTHVRHGWRYRLHLRPGDTYTRYWDRLGDTPDFYRPARISDDPSATTPVGDFHGTGVWIQAPDLTTLDYRRSMHDESGLVHVSEAGPGPNLRPAVAGQTAYLDLKIDSANVTTSANVLLQGRRDGAEDRVRLLCSRDAGLNWTEVWTAGAGDFDANVALSPDLVGGAHEYLLRVEMFADADPAGCGLDRVHVTSLTQVNAFTLPRFQLGENKVRFALGEQLASQTLWPVLHDDGGGGRYRETAESWDNVDADPSPDAFYGTVLRPATNTAPAQVTWRLDAPTPLVRVDYGGSFATRSAVAGNEVRLSHAFDGGAFVQDAVFDRDSAETWDARVFASVDAPPGADEVRLRFDMESTPAETWQATGIQDLLLTVLHEPRDPGFAPVEVTFQWTEWHDGEPVVCRHTRRVERAEDLWLVNVGGDRDPDMDWVRLRLADGPVAAGYLGADPGPDAGYDKIAVRYDLLDDVTRGAAYTVSRPATGANPDDGGELTDGCIIPPSTYTTGGLVQGQTALWAPGAPVTVDLDLGASTPVAALRVSTHQPNAEYGHPAAIDVAISNDGEIWTPYGTVTHDQVWRPEGPYLDWGLAQSSAFDDLPARGRLAYPFWIRPEGSPESTPEGRYLRVTVTPQDGCGFSLSEIQGFSQVTIEDWPDREVWMPATSTAIGDRVGSGAPAVRMVLHCAPNPFNPRTRVDFVVQVSGPVSLRVYDLRGREVRVLRDRPLNAGRHSVDWDGRDAAGRPVPAGIYFLALKTVAGEGVAKAVVVK